MAALPVLLRDERNGTVFVQDEREDGTQVLLTCREGDGGVAVDSHRPNEVWLTGSTADENPPFRSLFPTDFTLVLDTSQLPAGRHEFNIGRFVDRAQAAVEAEERLIFLDEAEARKWGLVKPRHRSDD